MVIAYSGRKDSKPKLTMGHLFDTIKDITPIAKLMPEEISSSREWAKKHGTKNASNGEPENEGQAIIPKRKLSV